MTASEPKQKYNFEPELPNNTLPFLPPKQNFDEVEVLKKVILASRALTRYDVECSKLPNPILLIKPMTVREAVASSQIENIYTTVSEVFEAELFPETSNKNDKEAKNYNQAILYGYNTIVEKNGLGTNDIIKIQSILEPNKTGIRKIPGTKIQSSDGISARTIYTPPDRLEVIIDLLSNFEKHYNQGVGGQNTTWAELDPLIKLPILHYQFESIHPFLDGNGRTGRILNILYLVLEKQISSPTLFLSQYILENKNLYYWALQKVNKEQDYLDLVLFFLDAIIVQAEKSCQTVLNINELITDTKAKLKGEGKEFLNMEFLEYIFSKPLYTIKDLSNVLGQNRVSCSKYLNKLVRLGIATKVRQGKEFKFENTKYLKLLS